MDFNDGSQYRVVTDPARQLEEREVYCFRAASWSQSRGGLYVDTAFHRHRTDLAAMPALLMYQFVYAHTTPEAQADFLVDALGGPLRSNEMVMLDTEAGGGFTNENVWGFARRWLTVVEEALQCRAWVYVPSALAVGLDRTRTGQRLVMAPRYSGGPQRGAAPWWPHDVHQFTDRGPFPGCPETGDVSFTSLTAQQMLARCNPAGITCECSEGATRGV